MVGYGRRHDRTGHHRDLIRGATEAGGPAVTVDAGPVDDDGEDGLAGVGEREPDPAVTEEILHGVHMSDEPNKKDNSMAVGIIVLAIIAVLCAVCGGAATAILFFLQGWHL